MLTPDNKNRENKNKSVANAAIQKKTSKKTVERFEDNRPQVLVQRKLQAAAENGPNAQKTSQLQLMTSVIQKKENRTGLPDNLKSGIENLSGHSMDDVKVQNNSDKPAQLNAHAYVQGTDIHVAPGQEKHLPHEAWHVVQQKQGRVQPTAQLKSGVNINNDSSLEKEADEMGAKALQMKEKITTESEHKKYNSTSKISQFVVQKAEGEEAESTVAEAPAVEEWDIVDYDEDEEWDILGNDEGGPAATENGYKINPKASQNERKLLSKHGEKIASNVKTGAEMGNSVYKVVEPLYEANMPGVQGATILERTQNVVKETISGKSILKKITFLASPVISITTGIIGAVAKWTQWNAFEKAAIDPQTKEQKKGAPPEAVYGLSKVWKGFARKIKDVFMGISNFVANLLMLIPGAQIVAGPWMIFNRVVSLVDSYYKSGKKLYQFLMGEKKESNANSLLEKALNNDQEALSLILGLELSSISGTGFELLDKMSHAGAKAKSGVKGKIGMNQTEDGAKRIIDIVGWGSEGPQNTNDLHVLLESFCTNPDSKKLILSDLKEAMTGYGT